MRRFTASSSAVIVFVALSTALACGSSDEEGGNKASQGGSGGVLIIGPGGTLPPGADARNGGSVELTPEQASSLQNAACRDFAAAGENLPTALQLVIDVSSSMNEGAPGSRRSKWEVTRDALLRAIPGDGPQFPGLDPGVPLGVLYYPNVAGGSRISTRPSNIQNCVNTDALIPIAPLGGPGAPQRSRVTTSLNQVQLSTGTPTRDAFQYALTNGMLPFEFNGNRFMLLITDGTPTLSEGCSNPSGQLNAVDPQPVVNAVAGAYDDHGIRTFIIGSPGSEGARESLSAAARRGGTASSPDCRDNGNPQYCHMDLTAAPDFDTALREGLGSVVGQIKSCTYEFPAAPAGQTLDPLRVNVVVRDSGGTTSLLLPDETPDDCTVGFQLTSDQRVVLCPETCGTVQADTRGSIELLFGCQADELVR
jgi:hypothetical protein